MASGFKGLTYELRLLTLPDDANLPTLSGLITVLKIRTGFPRQLIIPAALKA